MKFVRKISVLILLLACFQSAQAGWTRQNAGTLAWLRSIYFLNEKKGWIAGSQGTFLLTEDGGTTWKQTVKFTDDTILDVYFADAQTGWILCDRSHSDAGALAPSYLMRTSDGGASWENIEFNEARARMARLFFTASGDGYAVGESGAVFAMLGDRKSWKRTPFPSRHLLLDGIFTDALHGAIVGGGRTILFTEDAGLTWNNATVAGKSETKLNSIFFVNPKNGWTVGAGGKIYTTANGGKFWREQNSATDKNLTDVYFVSTAEGWAIGDAGAILHTATGGNVWTAAESNARHKLEKIAFAGKKGFAVGFGGTLLVYSSEKGENMENDKPQLHRRTR